MKYVYVSQFVVLSCSYVLVDFTYIVQGYFTGTEAILRLPQCQ